MEQTKKIVQNSSFLITRDFIDKILVIIISIFLARYLGPQEFGKYSFAYAFVSLFTILINFGLEPLIIREVAKYPGLTNRYFINASFVKLLMCSFAFTLICITLFFLKKPIDITLMVLIIALSFFPGCITGILISLFNAHQMMKYPSIITIIIRIITFCVSIYLLTLHFGAFAMIFIGFLGSVFTFIWLFYLKKKINVSFTALIEFSFCKNLLKDAIPFFTFSLLAIYNWKIDITMLSIMKGNQAVGQYSAAYKIIDGLLFIPGGFMLALYPVMSKLFITDFKRLKETFEIAFKYLFILILPIVLGINLLAERIILLLYKNEYLSCSLALQILMWALLLLYIKYPLGTLFTATGKMKILNLSTAGALTLNFLLNLYFIKKWGFIGASITTLIGEVLTFFLLLFLAMKYLNNFKFLNFIFKPILASLLMSLYVIFLKKINLFLLIFSAAIFYFCLLFLFKVFSEKDIKIIKQLMPQFFTRRKNK